jgi:hypothetical protein
LFNFNFSIICPDLKFKTILLVNIITFLIIIFSACCLNAEPGKYNINNVHLSDVSSSMEANINSQDRDPLNKDLLSGNKYSHLNANAVNLLNYNLKKLLQKNGQRNSRAFKKLFLETEILNKEVSVNLFEKFSSGIYQSSWNDFVS